MATSPIYSWPEPDNTDLVKNGALAIRTLGNAIDTTMATMTPKSLVDAKGDLIAASANDTPARLAVGNNGETLVADSSTSTGLRYTAGNPIPNPVINSAFQVWQRGTSFSLAASSNNIYTADRWAVVTNANQATTISRQATGDTTNLPNIQYALRFQRNSGQTGVSTMQPAQTIETVNSIPYAGKTVTVSYYARAGANFSPTGSALPAFLATGTGTDQSVIGGFTGVSYAITGTATLTTTWQRFSFTGTVPTNATELGLVFNFTPTGTAGAADYFDLTGVQIDIGSVALPFRTYAGTIQGELAACQRYYQRQSTNGANNVAPVALGFGLSTTTATFVLKLTTTMRTAPTSLDASGMTVFTATSVLTPAGTLVISTNEAGLDNVGLFYTHGSAALATNAPYKLGFYGTNYIGVSAEL